MRLAESTVLITGGSSGIGAATATLLAPRCARLLLTGRDGDRLASLAKAVSTSTSASASTSTYAADLTDATAIDRLASWAGADDAGVDVLVCNAGIGWAGQFADMPAAKAAELITVNVTATIALARAFVGGMLARGRGHICFVSSIAGHMGVARESVYSATKSAINSFAEALRYETAHSSVTISVISPGVVRTEFFARRGTAYQRHWPRPIPPERVARAIVRAIDNDKSEIFVPWWLRAPARLHGAIPGIVSMLQSRFG